VKWLSEVTSEDYEHARNYLALKLDSATADKAVTMFGPAPLVNLRANDILRACGYPALGKKDPGVKKLLKHDGPVSPALITSFVYGADIAEGYHRISASYIEDPASEIPCKIIYLPDVHP